MNMNNEVTNEVTRTHNEVKDDPLNTHEERAMRYVLICLAIILAMIMLMSGCATTSASVDTYWPVGHEPVYVYKLKSIDHEVVHKPTYKRITRYVYRSVPVSVKRTKGHTPLFEKRRVQIDQKLKVIRSKYPNLPPCPNSRYR